MRAFCSLLRYGMIALLVVLWYSWAMMAEGHAAIPLITDDTGTQGKGKFQAEALAEYIKYREDGVERGESKITASLAYGMLDPVDVVVSLPYEFLHAHGPGFREKKDGLADLAFEMKWRFLDKDGMSFALKSGLVLPTGNERRGFGTGKVRCCLNLIASKELGPWSFDANGSYVRNENNRGERRNLWVFSAAFKRVMMGGLKLVGETGIESRRDGSSSVPPIWVGGGFICSPLDHFDIGFGILGGITPSTPDLSFRGGITVRF